MAACGLFLLNKEQGMTSQTAVNRVKRLFGEAKAGHTGTLDPMAEGVLPILLGRAVKASEFLLHGDKHYEAVLRLGLTSDTEDVWGTLTQTDAPLPRVSYQHRKACTRLQNSAKYARHSP